MKLKEFLAEAAKLKKVVNTQYVVSEWEDKYNINSFNHFKKMRIELDKWQEIADDMDLTPTELLETFFGPGTENEPFTGIEFLWILAGAPEKFKKYTDFGFFGDDALLFDKSVFNHLYGGERLKLSDKYSEPFNLTINQMISVFRSYGISDVLETKAEVIDYLKSMKYDQDFVDEFISKVFN